ncbi:MAG: cobalamin-binding protein [Gemmatimonadales bacterium]|nr:cobalamin-binding protein [Gemmatimonadales bacterium]
MPISYPPERIASLLPSATEIVRALGLEASLVAVSHSCDFPGRIESLPRVTRTRVPKAAPSGEIDAVVRDCLTQGESLYEIDVEALDRLQPDLVITQALCEVCAVGPGELSRVIPALQSVPEVLTLEPHTLEGAFQSIVEVGRATGRVEEAESLVASLRCRVAAIRVRTARRSVRPRVGFLEWIDPPMCGGHWNPELVELAGGRDGLGRAGQPSRTLRWEEILEFQPEVLVLACCGYTAERTGRDVALLRQHPGFADLPCSRTGRIYVLDGVTRFSRPGPGLVDSLEALAAVLGAGAD